MAESNQNPTQPEPDQNPTQPDQPGTAGDEIDAAKKFYHEEHEGHEEKRKGNHKPDPGAHREAQRGK